VDVDLITIAVFLHTPGAGLGQWVAII